MSVKDECLAPNVAMIVSSGFFSLLLRQLIT